MQRLGSLLESHSPLLIANVWDAPSVKMAAQCGYAIAGTSSAAIAESLGCNDGEQMPWSEMAVALTHIAKAANKYNIALSVDMEAGYSRNTDIIVKHLQYIQDIGAIGINIEDSIVKDGQRSLVNADAFADTLRRIVSEIIARKIQLYINVRTDCYLLLNQAPLKETLHRAVLYEKAGVQGLFVPGLSNIEDIQALSKNSNLTLNLMALPELTNFKQLYTLGVKRLSMGNFLHKKLLSEHQQLLNNIRATNSFSVLFAQ